MNLFLEKLIRVTKKILDTFLEQLMRGDEIKQSDIFEKVNEDDEKNPYVEQYVILSAEMNFFQKLATTQCARWAGKNTYFVFVFSNLFFVSMV